MKKITILICLCILLNSCGVNRKDVDETSAKILNSQIETLNQENASLKNSISELQANNVKLQTERDSLQQDFNSITKGATKTIDKNLISFEQDAPIGIATLEGYYTQIIRDSWDEKVTCDSFVITGGNSDIINFYNERIKSGNSLQSFDKNNNIVVGIDFNTLGGIATKGDIIKSSETNQISLEVALPKMPGIGAGPCTSLFHILNIKY